MWAINSGRMSAAVGGALRTEAGQKLVGYHETGAALRWKSAERGLLAPKPVTAPNTTSIYRNRRFPTSPCRLSEDDVGCGFWYESGERAPGLGALGGCMSKAVVSPTIVAIYHRNRC